MKMNRQISRKKNYSNEHGKKYANEWQKMKKLQMSRKTDGKNYANGLGRNHEDEWENYVNGRKKQLQGGKCK